MGLVEEVEETLVEQIPTKESIMPLMHGTNQALKMKNQMTQMNQRLLIRVEVAWNRNLDDRDVAIDSTRHGKDHKGRDVLYIMRGVQLQLIIFFKHKNFIFLYWYIF